MAAPNPERLRKLREEAQAAFQKQKYAEALSRLDELERLQPMEADWPRRAAECHRALGQKPQQIDALSRAAERYIESGFVVKAIAVCKVILGLDPTHTRTQERLEELQPSWQRATGPAPNPAPAARGKSEPGRPRVPLEEALRLRRTGQRPKRTESTSSSPANTEDSDERESATVAQARDLQAARESQAAITNAPPLDTAPPRRRGPPPLPMQSAPSQAPESEAARSPSIQAEPQELTQVTTRSNSSSARVSIPPLTQVLPSMPPPPLPSGRPSGMHHIVLDEELIVEEDEKPTFSDPAILHSGLFAELSPQSLGKLIERAKLERVSRGTTIVRQGEPASALYVIVSGSVAVIEEGVSGSEMRTLGPNDFFGESSLITHQPELATAEATQLTELLAIDQQVVQELLQDEPHTLKVLLCSLRERFVEQFLLANRLFTAFSGPERRDLARRFQFLEVTPGSVLIEQGGHAMGLFLLLLGRLQIVRWDGQFAEQIAELDEGQAFGNLSLLTREPAGAEVYSPERAFALMLPEQDLRELIMTHPQMLEFVSALNQEFSQMAGRRTETAAHARTQRG